ncbi:right-handed parallel beta-helix repeat-containing protein [Microvirga sp. STR05]|uniref:Right-handed parallel beta-helix repeat-containing protein n=1 Tax=Hymenobacter duratus TaxID=2771356 RepID=A0ABR8JBB4_9BACT|nr:right-handed parallel beta-helix repeat-containing protein [Hymenobacter duratus]MBD2713974.1 right-handed parallel beta-helix repeat-containing protein [Hymenobacter duratus]MBR7948876.1 right-handed parallel beta-helix repeat-containing protein [Microvirga sp. STR05]
MKSLLRSVILMLAWGALGQTTAWAQATAKDQSAQILNPNDGRTQLLQPLAVSAGTVTGYTITGPLPTAGQGTLWVNGTQVTTVPRTVSLADADNIEFDPSATFFGTYFFNYTAQGSGGVNTAASYGISVSDAACSVASALNLFSRADESWEGPTYPSITVSGTTLTASAFTQSASANGTTVLGVLDDLTMPGKALTWSADYSSESTTANASSITFSFSRPVKNFSMTVGDLDVGSITATNPWIDQLTVQGYPTTASTTPYVLTAAEYTLGPNGDNIYSGNNVFTGTGENAATSPDLAGANLIITFSQAVQKVTLIYRNTTTTASGNDPAKQVLTIPSMSWCAEADVTTTLTGPGSLSAGVPSGNYTATFTNNGPDAAAATTRTVTIPANRASAVNGGANGVVSGSQAAGWTITFPAGTNVASGNTVSYNFSLTPALTTTGQTIGVVSNTSTTTDEGSNVATNSATVTYTVGAVADLTTTLTAPATLSAGVASGSYTATFTNNGPSTAASTTRTVTIPANTASAVSGGANGAVSGSQAAGWTITFPAGTNVASGNTVSYNFTLTPLPVASVAVTSTTGNAGTTSQGLNVAADSDTKTTTVTPIADVTTTLTGPSALTTGVVSGNYTATFTNNGPSPSAGTTRTVSIPANTASAVSAPTGTVSGSQATGWTITYPGGTLASGNSASYTFTLTPAPAVTSIAVISNTGTTTSQGADAAPNSATVTQSVTLIALSGRVFEDVNYSGGTGRNLADANTSAQSSGFANNAIRRPNATVELYDANGNFLATTVTDGTGLYSFNVPAPADYTVRVVSSTVTSVRPRVAGNTDALVPVQTFVQGDLNRVGGEAPEKQDAPANTGSQTLAQLTAGAGASATTAQSIDRVTVAAGGQTGINFGFNFDVVNNTRDAGQGSLRQFLLNSNALSNNNLAQTGLTAGTETSIFMIPSGGATAGLRAGLVSGLTDLTNDGTVNNRVAVITPLSAFPSITDSNTRIDGTEQTTNVGNTNNVTLGTGGTVGVTPTALGQLNGPEVQIVGIPGQAGSDFGLTVAATNTTITGLAIYGFGNTAGGNIYVTTGATSGTLLTGNVIGSGAAAFADPGAAARSTGHGIYLQAGTDITTLFSGTISNNLIGYNSTAGVEMLVNANGNGTTTGYLVEGNEIRGNALGNSSSDGIRLGVNGGVMRNNLIAANQGPGVDLAGSTGNALITNNTIDNNGLNGGGQTAGIRLQGAANTLSQNVVSNNYGAGIMAQNATTTSLFTKNSIFGNGAVLTAVGGAASGQLGIDLLNPADNANQGSGTYVSPNANGKTSASGANGLLNFPVMTQAVITNTTSGNLQITGYAPAGSVIEFFLSDRTTAGFGQGKTYLFSTTEGASMTAAANGTAAPIADAEARFGNYSGTINGVNNGAETGAARFLYSIPLSSLTAGQRTALTTGGARLTATATTGGTTTSEFSSNILISQNTPLPVELKTFDVTAQRFDAKLAWSTASEKNNDHFDVERSFDGRTFERVIQVRGQGTTSQTTTYTFTDANIGSKYQGLVYYRLQQVDTDGTAVYSPVRTVSFAARAAAEVKLSVFPNPATSQDRTATLDLTTLPAGAYQATLLDATGRTMGTYPVQGGVNKVLNIQALPSGAYIVLVRGNNLNLNVRLMKD